MFVVCSSFENVLTNISCFLGHVQVVDNRPLKGRLLDGDENLHRDSALHLAQEALYTSEIVLQGQTRQTLGTVNSFASHN